MLNSYYLEKKFEELEAKLAQVEKDLSNLKIPCPECKNAEPKLRERKKDERFNLNNCIILTFYCEKCHHEYKHKMPLSTLPKTQSAS